MASLETTFLVDLLNGVPEAVDRARRLEAEGDPRCVTPPAAAETLVGAHFLGGEAQDKARDLLRSLNLLEFDGEAFEEAGRLGAELLGRGQALGTADLLIAAVSMRHGQRVITRDRSFSRVPGLEVETY